MKEYIERETAVKFLRSRKSQFVDDVGKGWNAGIEAAVEAVGNLPEADVAPVRHGRWLTTDAYPHRLYCSVCYKTYAKNAKWVNELELPVNYCPNCGARMGKEDEHD